MLSDGTNAFTWNARNQVASLNSVSLQYDAFGRRIQNAAGKSFLYDGANPAQELSGSTVLANLLSGGIDEMFTRSDSSGTYTPLQDALGSTIALVDSSGNIATAYAYDPFGNTTVSGLSNSNAFQYTGRENEGNGLYFYRARYYSPELGRFINEDPLGFAGSGADFYAYVGNDPIDFSDPFGLARGDWWDPRSYYTDGWTTLRDVGTAAEAFTDAITFGSASKINDAFGANVAVDRCGIGHKLASAAGFIASIALGAGEGAEIEEANAPNPAWATPNAAFPRGIERVETSHWLSQFKNTALDGEWNTQEMWGTDHALNDPSRYQFLRTWWKAENPINNIYIRQWNLMPGWAKGSLIGGAVGTAGALGGRSCECH